MGWWNTMGMGREIIIVQTNKRDGKAIKENRRRKDPKGIHKSRKKG
jgi:hypothetical protein